MIKRLKILLTIIISLTFGVNAFALDVVTDLKEPDGEVALNEELRKLDVERKNNDTDISTNVASIATNAAAILVNEGNIATNTALISGGKTAKGYVTFDGTDSNPITPDGSFNVTGTINKTGTGTYIISWDTDFANTTYCVVATFYNAGGFIGGGISSKATDSCTIISKTYDGSAVDAGTIDVVAFGDQ